MGTALIGETRQLSSLKYPSRVLFSQSAGRVAIGDSYTVCTVQAGPRVEFIASVTEWLLECAKSFPSESGGFQKNPE